MCGIAGWIELGSGAVDRAVLERMTQTLRHRGPDAGGVVVPSPRAGLGHRRLAIIDLTTGDQPMASPDGKVWVVFNGEIFNFRELRPDLERRRRFTTTSDTEVLLALYEERGIEGLSALRGQYALAIWDGREAPGRLVLARDPLGLKPLYVWRDEQRLLFASEPRAILAHPAVRPAIDPLGVHLFLRYRFIPAPRTAWQGMTKLRPGEVLTLDGSEVALRRTWQLDPREVERTDDLVAARAALAEALDVAIARQKIADVPVGAFLSGGLDSSTIATLLARRSASPIATFTIGFDEPGYDERPFAAEVAQRIGSAHVAETMAADAAQAVIPAILTHLDEPFGDPSIVPTWLLCQLASRHGKVALSGDGGDELFGGYGRTYRALGILEWPRLLRPMQRALRRVVREGQDPARWKGDDPRVDREYVRLLVDVAPGEARALYGSRLAALADAADGEHDPIQAAVRRHAGLPPFSRILAADMECKLADYHLVKVDRAAMAHGLEVRVPFLDEDLVRLAFSWTPRVRLSGGRSKGLLRDVMARDLPDSVLTREKKGFGPPLSHWFRDGLLPAARARLLDGAAVSGGWLQRAELDRMTDPGNHRPKGSRLWRLLVLEEFLRRG